jgi:hypothetical protein
LTQFCAAFGAGFFMATTVAPFDMVRTRLMNQPPDAKIYNGFVDCVLKVLFVVWVVIVRCDGNSSSSSEVAVAEVTVVIALILTLRSLLPNQIVKNGGPQALYAGFIPIWARFAPTTCLQLVIFEQIKPIFGVEGSGE